jgi:predicted outer membrane protein
MRVFHVVASSLATVFMGAAVFSQQPESTQTRDSKPAGGQVVAGPQNAGNQNEARSQGNEQKGGQAARLGTNEVIAACLAIDNKEEIDLANFAKDKVSDKSVKDFAKMLAEEHQSCLDSIHQAAPNVSKLSKANDASNNETTGQNGKGAIDMVRLHQEIANQCLEDTKQKLGDESGQKLDKSFVGMQIAKHAAMHTKLTVFQKHATGDLKVVIAEGLEKTKKHLKVAENLMASLDEADSNASSNSRK